MHTSDITIWALYLYPQNDILRSTIRCNQYDVYCDTFGMNREKMSVLQIVILIMIFPCQSLNRFITLHLCKF